MTKFDGKKIKDKILSGLKEKVAGLPTKPILAVISIGDDPVSVRYVGIKEEVARAIGVDFQLVKIKRSANYSDILQNVRIISKSKVNGVMIQLPLPKKINCQKIIEAIPAEKDIDGLRFCAGLDFDFLPPVILAILQALKTAKVDLSKANVVIVGQGFLVGVPLKKVLENRIAKLTVANIETVDIKKITTDADIIISATGKPGIIKKDMVRQEAILIDAGTTEVGGKLCGDIDPAAYKKSSFYTPVPGGIGPVTVAMLYKNLVK